MSNLQDRRSDDRSNAPENAALLVLEDVSRTYRSGPAEVRALDCVSLTIREGEFVSIMGQSGSGKSTLMNVLGCLDRPTAGRYRVAGRDAGGLEADELAALRRETFGFVFQRYNLLSNVSAAENVEVPAIYAGTPPPARRSRANTLLATLGLGDRTHHRPNELSGGQQQRVSIARALMNDPAVVLADEPTGALDSRSSEEVMALLKELHAAGRTVIVITHDPEVAAFAPRRIALRDGRVISDEGSGIAVRPHRPDAAEDGGTVGVAQRLSEAVKTALRSLRANVFRTALTLLGVVIGVAAVVTMLAIGEGSQRDVLSRIEEMGSDLLFVRPGAPGTRTRGDAVATLTVGDAEALAGLDNVLASVPEREGRATLRANGTDYATSITGTNADYPTARSRDVSEGTFFQASDLASYSTVAVLGRTVADNLFPNGGAIGNYVLISGVPFTIIGLLEERGASSFGQDQDDVVLVPITTGFVRLFGRSYLSSLTVRVADTATIAQTESEIVSSLIARHGTEDFQVRNTASLLETVQGTQRTFTILLGSVAAVSLIVGGIGVMNIMLVSVSERTREIGVRMATGARRSDIMLQFSTEALVVGCLGGVIGVLAGVGTALGAARLGTTIALTPEPAILAFCCAVVTGLVFGYLPARQAARMDPVRALATE
ncbi:MacB family efflux pump subunit [Parvularcula dongshanensis]|uniref:Macrolide transport system ATP-binding/permease protein n=1 Tax=Parvularcula dongshanensis TaxID=1173995 RepID=A0A840I7V7_9PROT|nr:MacB family efflux pump subunit [Parvularcula dongshanensis]MBB4660415.1 macrolide transport system ATP-binding/permease protein [Parvularcula dongshanensis]